MGLSFILSSLRDPATLPPALTQELRAHLFKVDPQSCHPHPPPCCPWHAVRRDGLSIADFSGLI